MPTSAHLHRDINADGGGLDLGSIGQQLEQPAPVDLDGDDVLPDDDPRIQLLEQRCQRHRIGSTRCEPGPFELQSFACFEGLAQRRCDAQTIAEEVRQPPLRDGLQLQSRDAPCGLRLLRAVLRDIVAIAAVALVGMGRSSSRSWGLGLSHVRIAQQPQALRLIEPETQAVMFVDVASCAQAQLSQECGLTGDREPRVE